MKNITPLLEDVMRVLYTLQNEGYIKLELIKYILEKKYNVTNMFLDDKLMTCFQGDRITYIEI